MNLPLAVVECAHCGHSICYTLADFVFLDDVAIWPAPGNCPRCKEISNDAAYRAAVSAAPMHTYHREGIWNVQRYSAGSDQTRERLSAIAQEAYREDAPDADEIELIE